MISNTIEHPIDDRIGTRRHRRTAVVALYGGYVVACAAYGATFHAAPLSVRVAGLAVVLAGAFAGAWAFFTLMRRTMVNAPNVPDADLDERERERKYVALRTAYPMLGILTGCVTAYVVVASTSDKWLFLREATLVTDLAWGLFLIAITLPTAILAWTEPDPANDR